MHNTFKPFVVGVAALAFTAFVGGQVFAQEAGQAPAQGPSQAQQASTTASGELLKVDSAAKTLTVKTSAAEMQFSYNDQTRIVGAQRGAAGLATMTGAQVTVQYKKEGSDNVATSIEVRSAQAPQSPQAPQTPPR